MKKITMIGKTLILGFSLTFASQSVFANGQGVPSNNRIIGDQYWSDSKNDDIITASKFNISNISASSVEKTLKVEEESKINSVRAEMLQNAAMAFGTQAGLANAGAYINRKLETKSGILDATYDFRKIQLEPGFLPPVITEGRDAYNQPAEDEVRAADTIYKIEFPARIVNAAPDWRTYLFVNVTEPETPNKAVLPQTSAESKLWDKYIKMGWEQGYEQASDLYEIGLNRLNRDFKGMLRYKKLYEMGMVTKPKLSKTELGVTGGGNEMSIGDRIIKKTQDAELNPKTKTWFK